MVKVWLPQPCGVYSSSLLPLDATAVLLTSHFGHYHRWTESATLIASMSGYMDQNYGSFRWNLSR